MTVLEGPAAPHPRVGGPVEDPRWPLENLSWQASLPPSPSLLGVLFDFRASPSPKLQTCGLAAHPNPTPVRQSPCTCPHPALIPQQLDPRWLSAVLSATLQACLHLSRLKSD